MMGVGDTSLSLLWVWERRGTAGNRRIGPDDSLVYFRACRLDASDLIGNRRTCLCHDTARTCVGYASAG